MLRLPLICTLIGVLLWGPCHGATERQVQIVATPPSGFSAADSVHLVGTFNQWALDGKEAVVMGFESGQLHASIAVTEQPVLINFVKNKDWSKVAATKTGKSTCGHFILPHKTGDTLQVSIDGWMSESPTQDVKATLTGDIRLFQDFAMPQLSRKGDIAVFLPPSYKQSKDKRFPVLYMLDGQNVFDEMTSYSNEWRVDELLSTLFIQGKVSEFIVVAVPNGPRRWNEYNPWNFLDNNNKAQTGEGNNTIAFITRNLKPFIDDQFRTKREASSTGLAGSSLGGMMAVYAALAHHDTFGFVAAFSPSLAVQNVSGQPALLQGVAQSKQAPSSRIYLDMGLIEYSGYDQFDGLHQGLMQLGINEKDIKVVKDDEGRHCELDWSKRFPAAMEWLMKK